MRDGSFLPLYLFAVGAAPAGLQLHSTLAEVSSPGLATLQPQEHSPSNAAGQVPLVYAMKYTLPVRRQCQTGRSLWLSSTTHALESTAGRTMSGCMSGPSGIPPVSGLTSPATSTGRDRCASHVTIPVHDSAIHATHQITTCFFHPRVAGYQALNRCHAACQPIPHEALALSQVEVDSCTSRSGGGTMSATISIPGAARCRAPSSMGAAPTSRTTAWTGTLSWAGAASPASCGRCATRSWPAAYR